MHCGYAQRNERNRGKEAMIMIIVKMKLDVIS